jgi:alpha-galactosidase
VTQEIERGGGAAGPPTVALIGAAGLTFGAKVLRDLIHYPELEGAVFRFMDIDEHHLEIMARLARRLLEQAGLDITVESTLDREAALQGADYVLISVETDRWGTWKQDFAVPRRLGSRQVYGELGGPGGLFHSLRQLPLHLDIARDIEAICPQAMVMIESNPLNRICLALERHSQVCQVVGLCHGVEVATNHALSAMLGVPGDDIAVVAAGTNHFTWILDLRRRSTGEDLYPALRRRSAEYDPTVEPLSRKLLEVYGYYPAPGDTHIGEYLPHAWEWVKLDGSFLDRWGEDADARWRFLEACSRGEIPEGADYLEKQTMDREELRLKEFFSPRDWTDTLAFPIFSAMRTNQRRVMPALNLLNAGAIDNLPADVFVETPGVVDSSGVRLVAMGELPKPLAAFCRRDVDQAELTVEAAVTGDRRVLLQAMLVDPVCDSIATAERVLEEMLKLNAEYLPQFS